MENRGGSLEEVARSYGKQILENIENNAKSILYDEAAKEVIEVIDDIKEEIQNGLAVDNE